MSYNTQISTINVIIKSMETVKVESTWMTLTYLQRKKIKSPCTNYINIQSVCGNRDETINHKISEYSKLAQREYKVRHDWVGKGIHWEICKKFKFDHTNKLYMYNPAPVL